MPLYTENVDVSIYDNTALTNLDTALELLEGDAQAVVERINEDAAYQYARPLIIEFYTALEPEFQRLNSEINALQTRYMKALMEILPEERYFPDANSTLRVTYGIVNGYSPRDAVYYEPVTYLDCVMEK